MSTAGNREREARVPLPLLSLSGAPTATDGDPPALILLLPVLVGFGGLAPLYARLSARAR